jgi:hypothetical protein
MARLQEGPMKVLRGMVPCYADIEPVNHLVAKDAGPLECSLPCQTLLVRGSVLFKEGEETKASPYYRNQFNKKKLRDLEKEGICYFTDGSKMCNQESVGL